MATSMPGRTLDALSPETREDLGAARGFSGSFGEGLALLASQQPPDLLASPENLVRSRL
jgi:hypothetical protein